MGATRRGSVMGAVVLLLAVMPLSTAASSGATQSGAADLASAPSPSRRVPQKAERVLVTPAMAAPGSVVMLTGTIEPSIVHAVELQLRTAGQYVTVQTGETSEKGHYTFSATVPSDRFRAVYRVFSPEVVDPKTPIGLAQIIMRCLAKNPADRYQRGHDLADALLGFISAQQALNRGPTPAEGRAAWLARLSGTMPVTA